MKRRTLKLIVCAAITALTLSVTACGGSDDANTADTTEVEETVETEEETVETEEVSSGQKTLEEYLKEDPATEKELEEQAKAQGNDQMDMTIEVKGNELFCVATFKDSVELPDDVAETLEESMGEVEPVFSALAGVLDEAIGAEKGTVSYGVRYCASDGSVLAEASFTAK